MASNLIPTVTANLALVLSASVAADIQTHWLAQKAGSPGSLLTPMSETDTTFTFAPGSAPGSGFGFVGLAPGNTILVESEPMTVAAIEGETVTIARSVAPLPAPAGAHSAGAAIYLLRYRDPWLMIADEALRPWAQNIVAALGAQSATFGALASGSLVLNQP